MYAIIAIGLLTIGLSSIMLFNPKGFSRGLAAFAEKSWFHIFEIVTRIALGAVLIAFAASSSYPNLLFGLGCLFVFAGVILIVMGSRRHREFAAKSAGFGWLFRPAGVAGILFGSFLLYTVIV